MFLQVKKLENYLIQNIINIKFAKMREMLYIVRYIGGIYKSNVFVDLRKFVSLITSLHIVLWCNWQHAWFWSRRVEVRALQGQLSGCSVARLSRLVWDEEVAGSNPATPTIEKGLSIRRQLKETYMWRSLFY